MNHIIVINQIHGNKILSYRGSIEDIISNPTLRDNINKTVFRTYVPRTPKGLINMLNKVHELTHWDWNEKDYYELAKE